MAIATTRLPTFGSVRLERWPRDASTALIAQFDHNDVLDPDDLGRAVAAARAAGFRRARTSAVFAESAAVAHRIGFSDIDTLVLLSRSLDDDHPSDTLDLPSATVDGGESPDLMPVDRHRADRHRVRTLWPIEDRWAAAVDLDAFGPVWGSDRRGLGAIRRATPRHWAGAVGRFARPLGFVIAGIGSRQSGHTPGFVQRLAVERRSHRHGIARALLGAALRHLRDHRVTIVSVNTGIDNHAALALYRAYAFTPTDRLMYVAEIDLRSPVEGR